jgi:hypothetical protein
MASIVLVDVQSEGTVQVVPEVRMTTTGAGAEAEAWTMADIMPDIR